MTSDCRIIWHVRNYDAELSSVVKLHPHEHEKGRQREGAWDLEDWCASRRRSCVARAMWGGPTLTLSHHVAIFVATCEHDQLYIFWDDEERRQRQWSEYICKNETPARGPWDVCLGGVPHRKFTRKCLMCFGMTSLGNKEVYTCHEGFRGEGNSITTTECETWHRRRHEWSGW